MKKLFLILIVLTMCINSNAQTTTDTTKKSKFEVNTELTFATRNYCRGVSFGESPSIQGLLSVSRYGFELGTYGGVTTTGNKVGYGNWVESFLTYKHKNLSVTADDYFFFSEVDSNNNFFDYDHKTTHHYVELRVKYEYERIQLLAGYTIYSITEDVNPGIYAEATMNVGKGTSVFVGYITDHSMLNFMDAGGFNNVGVFNKRKIKISEDYQPVVKTTLAFNPSYQSITKLPGIGISPVSIIFAMTF
jgi:hypothetical protein